MSKHTPGPWTVDDHGIISDDHQSHPTIAKVYRREDRPIIAAAPDMYAALQKIWATGAFDQEKDEQIFNMIGDALGKAEGRE